MNNDNSCNAVVVNHERVNICGNENNNLNPTRKCTSLLTESHIGSLLIIMHASSENSCMLKRNAGDRCLAQNKMYG